MNIIFAGTPEVAVPSLHKLVEAGHTISLVITREDSLLGRKKILTASPVAQFAEEHSLPVLKVNKWGEQEKQIVSHTKADLGVVVAYGALLDSDVLSFPRHGWINLHFSKLPQWRGAAPVQWTIRTGQKESAISIFQLVEKLDAGEILSQQDFRIDPDETSGELLERLSHLGSQQLLEVIHAFHNNEIHRTSQLGNSSYAPKLSLEDGHLDLSLPASQVYDQYRSVTPEPGAYILWGESRLKIHHARFHAQNDLTTGVITASSGGITLGLNGGAMELIEVQPFGKNRMSAQAWWNGMHLNELVVR